MIEMMSNDCGPIRNRLVGAPRFDGAREPVEPQHVAGGQAN